MCSGIHIIHDQNLAKLAKTDTFLVLHEKNVFVFVFDRIAIVTFSTL